MTKATIHSTFISVPITNANLWSIDFAAKERHRCLSRLGTLRTWSSRVHAFIFSRRIRLRRWPKRLTCITAVISFGAFLEIGIGTICSDLLIVLIAKSQVLV